MVFKDIGRLGLVKDDAVVGREVRGVGKTMVLEVVYLEYSADQSAGLWHLALTPAFWEENGVP